MEHKGTAERPSVDTESYEVGDAFRLTIGDWNGTGFSYHNSKAEYDMIVIERGDDEMTAISYDDRLEWNGAVNPDQDLEVTVHADGSVDGISIRDWNEMVKEIKDLPQRGGEHMVHEGRLRTGRE